MRKELEGTLSFKQVISERPAITHLKPVFGDKPYPIQPVKRFTPEEILKLTSMLKKEGKL